MSKIINNKALLCVEDSLNTMKVASSKSNEVKIKDINNMSNLGCELRN